MTSHSDTINDIFLTTAHAGRVAISRGLRYIKTGLDMETKEHFVNRELFLELLHKRFPRVYADIDEIESGLLHLEMAVFSRATIQAIEEMRWKEVSEHFDFINEVFSRGNGDIGNAVQVSYLENVFIGEESRRFSQARGMLPPALSISLVDLEKHLDMLANMSD